MNPSGQKTNPYRDINILAAFVDATMMSTIVCLIRVGGGNYHGLVAYSRLHHWDSGPGTPLRNEYLAAENRIMKSQLKTRLRLTDAERITLAEIAHRLGRKALEDVANAVKPDTLMGWYRRLVAHKFDGSKSRRYLGCPRIDGEIEQMVVRMAKENSD